MSEVLTPFVEATVRTATPLAFAALGELVAERSGVINIGLEGTIIAGAFGGLVTAGAAGAAVGFLGAIAAGVLVAAIFAFFVVTLKSDHIITGTAISMLGEAGFLLTLNPSVPAKTTLELIAYAKANPGKIAYGSSGTGGTSHLVGELFDLMAGTQMTHVPYKSSGPDRKSTRLNSSHT